MSQEHTPGPWRWGCPNPGAPFAVYSPTRSIARLSIAANSVHAAEGMANGRLIAAAPELLEAIQPKTLRGVAVACRNASLPGQAACLEKLAEIQEAAIRKAMESGQ